MPVCKVKKCPTNPLLLLTNCAITNKTDFPGAKHIRISNASGQTFAFSIKSDPNMAKNEIGLSLVQRNWASLSLDEEIQVEPFNPDDILAHVVLEVDFMQKETVSQKPYNTDEMAKKFISTFRNQVFTLDQQLLFSFKDKKFEIVVRELQVLNLNAETCENSSLNLVGKSKRIEVKQPIFKPNWDFATMGIGGLSEECIEKLRKAFASRAVPPEVIQQLGYQHVKGILLYGPPGTGKTLIAQQISEMFNGCKRTFVNCSQSEANIRPLFAEAEEEEKRAGSNSGLHIIILDEIDAICKQRGSVTGAIVSHLMQPLNNILVIGTTNRIDLIDEALMRPGRLKVQVEISLPDKEGRIQILNQQVQILEDNLLANQAHGSKRSVKEGRDTEPKKRKIGILQADTTIQYERAENSSLNLVGKSRRVQVRQPIFKFDWDFEAMGIGGVTKENKEKFRLAFASRHLLPPQLMQQLDCKHVKGILLYGPPGIGKTLIAQQMSKKFHGCKPKFINCSQSEANIRRLFAKAEEEEKRAGPNSGLHIIVLDEIERICKQRGSVTGAIVSDLMKRLNNIVVIGTTNRIDLIDEALMRPGRLEVQVEISLPDEDGRIEILNIHTCRMTVEDGRLLANQARGSKRSGFFANFCICKNWLR